MVARALLRNSVSIEEWLTATTFVKYCTLKKLFPAINYKKKNVFSEQLLYFESQPFLTSLHLLFHEVFCTSVSKCSSMLFQRL